MPAPIYRPATDADVPAALDVFLEALQDLYARNNFPPTPVRREEWEPGYRHVFRTGIFWVAEIDGKVAAVCHANIRDRIWFLSGFWARPEYQRQKIGGGLLREVKQVGLEQGAETFFVWSTFDVTAVATYMRHGMLPGFQLMVFTGTPVTFPELVPGYTTQPLEIAHAMELDRVVRGTSREIDHRFWLEENEPRGLARQVVNAAGQVVGYYYHHDKTIGAAAWQSDPDGQALLSLALRDAVQRNEQARIVAPGINHTAIRFAMEAGLRLAIVPHLLMSGPFGKFDRYLPSGPTLF